MSRRRFPDLRRLVAMFCMALCFALSAETAIGSIEGAQHEIGIAHDDDRAEADNDASSSADHGPVAHHHSCCGMLTPLPASSLQFTAVAHAIRGTYPPDAVKPDAFERRSERPPKHSLEAFA